MAPGGRRLLPSTLRDSSASCMELGGPAGWGLSMAPGVCLVLEAVRHPWRPTGVSPCRPGPALRRNLLAPLSTGTWPGLAPCALPTCNMGPVSAQRMAAGMRKSREASSGHCCQYVQEGRCFWELHQVTSPWGHLAAADHCHFEPFSTEALLSKGESDLACAPSLSAGWGELTAPPYAKPSQAVLRSHCAGKGKTRLRAGWLFAQS